MQDGEKFSNNVIPIHSVEECSIQNKLKKLVDYKIEVIEDGDPRYMKAKEALLSIARQYFSADKKEII